MKILKKKLGLLFLIAMIFAAFIALTGCQAKNPTVQEVKPQNNPEPTVTAAPAEEKVPEDLKGFTEYTIKQQLGEKSYEGKDRIRKTDIQGSDKESNVMVELNGNDAFIADLTVKGMLMDSKKLLAPLAERKEVKSVSISEYLDVEDIDGSKVPEWVFTLTLDRTGLDKIASGDYILGDLPKFAVEYKLHPNFK